MCNVLHNKDEQTVRNAAGALANMASHNDAVQKRCVELGVIPQLIKLLISSNDGIVAMTSRALCNLTESGTLNISLLGVNEMSVHFVSGKSAPFRGPWRTPILPIINFLRKRSNSTIR